ncbi:hypothetical protein L1D29_13860 [Shewanella insulae]|uniref:hypothetical protein n=1 Tax=Shewanella insulae TaxID=2681496 RepID=UPI001EFD3848|nr:hypothetical protein [Shewanella insulae]MCG9713904.1 hypothetical protein [Shewanella insulae]
MNNQLRDNYRKETFGTLELISSKEEQLDYQNKVPIAHVSAELFCSWESCYQDVKDQDWYQSAFSKKEFEILKSFDATFEQVCSETEQDVPYITEFIQTKQWLTLSKAAKLALMELAAT